MKKKRIPLSKTQMYKITHKIYTFLKQRNGIIIWKKLRICGYCDDESDDIIIDPRKDFLRTIIHEILHRLHENWTEKMVDNYESKITNAMTAKQITNMIKVIAKTL